MAVTVSSVLSTVVDARPKRAWACPIRTCTATPASPSIDSTPAVSTASGDSATETTAGPAEPSPANDTASGRSPSASRAVGSAQEY